VDTAQLVKQFQSGNREALGLLYNLYAHSMMKVIENYVHNHDAAQDILHDGFIIALSALDNLKKPDKFESWLTTIMRNLSLQYLREATNHATVPMTDTYGEIPYEDITVGFDLSWDDLNGIIDKLPEGYNKVFRLAVLEGLSHKEIGKMLGIAPHSSSSQLSHAKQLLRRLITKHLISMGGGIISIFTIIFSIVMIWLVINRKYESDNGNLIANESGKSEPNKKIDMKQTPKTPSEDAATQSAKIIHRIELPEKENIAEVILPYDTCSVAPITEDTISTIPKIPVTRDDGLFADADIPVKNIKEGNKNNWSLAIAYSGNMGQDTDNRYRIPIGPDPDLPSGEPEEIDVIEKSKHYMPLTIGISLNYSLSNRWSVESGIRYTFLRSDFLRESEIENTEINQRIHYIGIPLKFNYRILGNTRFSVYGQGGVALDIPVTGTQSIMTWQKDWNKPEFNHHSISAPLQWSVEGGLGLQYHITPSLSIYAEPSFRYYFNPEAEIKTIRQDKPFEFTIPIGIRLNWECKD